MDMEIPAAVLPARRLFLHYLHSCNGGRLDRQVRLTAVKENSWSQGVAKIGLIEAARRLMGIPISVTEFPSMPGASSDNAPIKAMLARYKNEAKIYVSDEENFCHQRFYVAKELCHLMMDTGHTEVFVQESSDIVQLLKDLQLPDGHAPSKITEAFKSEILAYWGAVELLLPPEFTTKAQEILNSGSSDSLYQAALEFRVPKSIVERRYLDEDTQAVFEEIYKSHDYKTIDLVPVAMGPKRPKG